MRSEEALARRKIYDRERKRGVPENRKDRWTPEQKAHAVARDRDARHWKDAFKFYNRWYDEIRIGGEHGRV